MTLQTGLRMEDLSHYTFTLEAFVLLTYQKGVFLVKSKSNYTDISGYAFEEYRLVMEAPR